MANPDQREIDRIRERASLDRLIDNALIHYESQSMEKKDNEEDLMEWALITSRIPLIEADKKDGSSASPDTGESTLNPEEFAANLSLIHI